MKRPVGLGRAAWHRLSLVGLLVVAAVVGHGAAMAGGVHAASLPAHQSAPPAPMAHASDPDLGPGVAATGAESMRGDCGDSQALPRRGADTGVDALYSRLFPDHPFSDLATLHRTRCTVDPPSLPPRVRRALLQVFRI